MLHTPNNHNFSGSFCCHRRDHRRDVGSRSVYGGKNSLMSKMARVHFLALLLLYALTLNINQSNDETFTVTIKDAQDGLLVGVDFGLGLGASFVVNAHAPSSQNIGRSDRAGPLRRLMGNSKTIKDDDEAPGLTLGDLDEMMRNNEEARLSSGNDNMSGGIFNPISFNPNTGTGETLPQNQGQNNQQQQDYTQEENNNIQSHIKTPPNRLRRINLDLTGRVMCHLVSNGQRNEVRSHGRGSIPLFHIPSSTKRRLFNKLLPHNAYIGANYDLDHVWYGVTRWIGKCSWSGQIGGSHDSEEYNDDDYEVEPSVGMSSWGLDLEGERSVFDSCDSTVRLTMTQKCSSTSFWPSLVRNNPMVSRTSPHTDRRPIHQIQKASIEYDSAKYSKDPYSVIKYSNVQYAPTLSMNLQTPIFHPRLELRSRSTWIMGDRRGTSSASVGQRLEQIKEKYREHVPTLDESSSFGKGMSPPGTNTNNFKNVCKKLSHWLENDGWMPKRITTDLMGNLKSVSEVGFNRYKKEPLSPSAVTTKRPSLRSAIMSPVHNMGVRLRISKRIDWTSLGIFPWSGGALNANNANNSMGGGIFRSSHSQPMRLRLEVCGLTEGEDRWASIGVDVDPLDWNDSLKIILCQENVCIVGEER